MKDGVFEVGDKVIVVERKSLTKDPMESRSSLLVTRNRLLGKAGEVTYVDPEPKFARNIVKFGDDLRFRICSDELKLEEDNEN
ncbi:hypothetical protein D3C81_1355240 [compost metagenome]